RNLLLSNRGTAHHHLPGVGGPCHD
ncbi:hypothetical protein VN97_g11078, partial [Penicillium thymicola]